MKKAIDIAKVSARASAALSLGMIVSNVILAVGTFLVAGFLSASEYGLYSIVLGVLAFFNFFQDLGMNSAIVKYTAQYRAEGREEEIKKILATGFLFDALLGAGLSLTAFALSGLLAEVFGHRLEIKGLIEIASITIFSSSIMNASQSVFVGFEKTEFSSLTMILHAVLKSFVAPALVLLGYTIFGAVLGVIVASIAAAIFGITVFIFLFYKRLEANLKNFKREFKDSLAFMLRYGFPISISTILTGVLTQFYNFLVYAYCDNISIANYQMATNFTILIAFLTQPIAITLFPAFSKLDAERDGESLRKVFQMSVKYGSLLVLPASVAIMVLSAPLVSTLFQDKFISAPFYLSLLAIQSLYAGIGNLSINNLIMGQGKTKVVLKLTLLTFSTGISLSLVLIPVFKVLGLLATSLTAAVPNLLVGLWWIKKHFGVSIDKVTSGKLYLASGVASAL
ncbi:MAG: oligosaccharide flippase family protein, partial [Nitrososphaerota archaeon]